MLSLNLNLLSPNDQKQLKLVSLYRYARIIIYLFLAFSLLAAGTAFTARLMLQDNLNELLATSTTINERNKTLDRDITKLNNQLKHMSEIQHGFINWSNLVSDVSLNLPLGIELSYLSLEKSNGLTVYGQAKQRDDYLTFKNNLAKLPYLSNLSSPLSNILTSQNIDFQLAGQINLTAE
ncbi:hypothetical protein KKC17_00245 [Patescibacteria group bacterium]|nr:hypothetical protein [Patescibacteria group bacterium]